MPTAPSYPERETLRGFVAEIFRLVVENATPKQWADWLRAPVRGSSAKLRSAQFVIVALNGPHVVASVQLASAHSALCLSLILLLPTIYVLM